MELKPELQKELVHLAFLTLRDMRPIGGSGMYLVKTEDGKMSMEHWQARFIRVLKECGIGVNEEALTYQRASIANRKKMMKDPQVKARLEKYWAENTPSDS